MAGNMTFTMDRVDYDRIMRALNGMYNFEKNAVVKQGLSDAMQLFVDKGKSNIKANNPQGTGKLARSLKKKIVPTKGKGYAGGGPVKVNGKTVVQRHLHLVDRGTVTRFHKDGTPTGAMYRGKGGYIWGGKPYIPHGKPGAWTSAFESEKMRAANELMDTIENCINQIISRN